MGWLYRAILSCFWNAGMASLFSVTILVAGFSHGVFFSIARCFLDNSHSVAWRKTLGLGGDITAPGN